MATKIMSLKTTDERLENFFLANQERMKMNLVDEII